MAKSTAITRNDLQNILAHVSLGAGGIELTQAEYDELSYEEKHNGQIYFITDASSDKIVVNDPAPIGAIMAYGGATAPGGWLLCQGQAVSRTTYSELFAAIGTTYGSGNGSTTFNLPDLRGRIIQGAGTLGDETYSLGQNVDAGLPNITATATVNQSYSGSPYSDGSFSGAFHAVNMSGTQYYLSGRATGSGWINMGFDASLSNSVYGNSTTVQPPATVTNYIIKAKDQSLSDSSMLTMVDFFYPVGSYYETSNINFNPNTTFGGTWEKVEEGRFLQATQDNSKVGTTVAAGLPNITGGFTARTTDYSTSPIIYPTNGTNAFAYTSGGQSGDGVNQVNGSQSWYTYTFDASRVNSIYGNSTTVQPPAVLTIIWHRTA